LNDRQLVFEIGFGDDTRAHLPFETDISTCHRAPR